MRMESGRRMHLGNQKHSRLVSTAEAFLRPCGHMVILTVQDFAFAVHTIKRYTVSVQMTLILGDNAVLTSSHR